MQESVYTLNDPTQFSKPVSTAPLRAVVGEEHRLAERTTVSLAVTSFLVVVLLWLLDLGQFVYVYQLSIAIIATTGLGVPLGMTTGRTMPQVIGIVECALRLKSVRVMRSSPAS